MGTSLIEQGVSLMLYGMGVVFVFLTVLVLSVMAMSALLGRFFPGSVSEQTGLASTGESVNMLTREPDPTLRKVVQAAINEHRRG